MASFATLPFEIRRKIYAMTLLTEVQIPSTILPTNNLWALNLFKIESSNASLAAEINIYSLQSNHSTTRANQLTRFLNSNVVKGHTPVPGIQPTLVLGFVTKLTITFTKRHICRANLISKLTTSLLNCPNLKQLHWSVDKINKPIPACRAWALLLSLADAIEQLHGKLGTAFEMELTINISRCSEWSGWPFRVTISSGPSMYHLRTTARVCWEMAVKDGSRPEKVTICRFHQRWLSERACRSKWRGLDEKSLDSRRILVWILWFFVGVKKLICWLIWGFQQ